MRRCSKALALLGVILVGLLVVSLWLPLARRWLYGWGVTRVTQSWHRAAAAVLGIRCHRNGNAERGVLLVANHISWLDILVLGLDGPTTFIAKREVADWPLLGYLARQAGTLFIQRGDAQATQRVAAQMAEHLHRGERLVLFPEGTSSRGERVLKFHARLFQPALDVNAAVQAAALRYEHPAAPFVDDDEFAAHAWRLLACTEIGVELNYSPLWQAHDNRSALAQQCWAWVNAVVTQRATDCVSND